MKPAFRLFRVGAIAVCAVAFPLFGMAHPEGLAECLDAASRVNPRIQSANLAADAAGLDAEAARLSFRSPSFSASVGQTEEPVDAPFSTMGFSLPSDALSAQAGVEAPLVAGVYGGAGIRQLSHRADGESDGDDATSLGARLRIPLWRDRGFAANALDVESLAQEAQARIASARSLALDEYSAVAKSYSQLLFVAADSAEVERALDRAEALVKDAAYRAELQDVAEYQVYPARLEAAVRREELAGSRGNIATARTGLASAVGSADFAGPASNELATAGAALDAWAREIASADTSALLAADAFEACPELAAALATARSLAEAANAAGEAEKPDLDVVLGAGWGNEDDAESGRDAGYGAAIVFSTPLSRDGARARIDAARIRADAARADADAARLAAFTRHASAAASFTNACARLAMVEDSVTQARLALESEDERFSIGDGSSRNVLDAQKDLTNATRQKLSVAHQVIDYYIELRRSVGLPPVD